MDAREKHLRRLRRLRNSARTWSVQTGLLTGATAVLVPYHGLGLADAAWAAAAGGSLALAAWRWIDLRAMLQRPVPRAVTADEAAAMTRERWLARLRQLPLGNQLLREAGKRRDQYRMRGTRVASLWTRLERAAATLVALRPRLSGPAIADLLADADVAQFALRDLADRTLGVELALRSVPDEAVVALTEAHEALMAQLDEGICAYEGLVGACATYVAETIRMPGAGASTSVTGLAEAAELLRCVAQSLSELRRAAP